MVVFKDKRMKIKNICKLLFLAVMVVGCNNKCEPFDGMPEFDGLQTIQDIEELDFSCVDYELLPRTQVVLNDTGYQELVVESVYNGEGCESYTVPSVDFNERTVLWNVLQFDCSNLNTVIKKKISREGNQLTYIIKVESTHFACGFTEINAVSIPKISETDTVIFKVVTYGCN